MTKSEVNIQELGKAVLSDPIVTTALNKIVTIIAKRENKMGQEKTKSTTI